MSLFGRAVGAFGGSVAQVANKYLDEQLIQQRAQMMADLQRTTAGNIRADDLNFKTANADKTRELRAGDMMAEGAAARAVKTDELNDTGLTNAAIARDGLMSKAKATQARDQVTTEANDTDFLAAKGKIALADPEVAARIASSKASAASAYASAGANNAQADGIRLSNNDKKKLDVLYDQASGILSDPELDDDGRGKAFAKVQQQITLIKSKNGAGGRDPELDREKITEETTDPKTGKVTKTERTEVRRPGQGGNGAAPDPLRAALEAARAERDKDKPKPNTPGAPRATDSLRLETTTSADGKPMVRFSGQTQWYASRTEAIVALGRKTPQSDGNMSDFGPM